jgi:uncharacterized protein YbaR (Trm112 family)
MLSGTQQVTGILEKLTGSDFISELKSFFLLIQDWQSKLRETIFECQKILISPTTEFLLVCPFDKNQFLSAEEISRKIYNEGFNLHHMVINQVPDWLDEPQTKKNIQLEQFKNLYLSTLEDIKRQITTTHKNLKVYKSFNISQNLRNEDLLKIYQNITLF